MSASEAERAEYEYLQTPTAIRERCERIYELASTGRLEHFELHESRLPEVADRVVRLTRAQYSDLSRIPYHGRYRHFDAGGVPRLAQFTEQIEHFDAEEQLAARFELVITSVLLDAGAGPAWRFRGAVGVTVAFHVSDRPSESALSTPCGAGRRQAFVEAYRA